MPEKQDAPLYEIEIGIVVPALICLPIWLSDERGFLREERLTVRLRSFRTTEGTTAGLRDGIVPITISSPEGSILDALHGGDLRLVAGFVNRPPLSMIAQPRFHSIAELRGASLGTTSLTEGTCHLMERMMAAHGLHGRGTFGLLLRALIRNVGKHCRREHSTPRFSWYPSTTLRRKQAFQIWGMSMTTSPISFFARCAPDSVGQSKIAIA